MLKIVLIHPQAGIDWQNDSAIFAIELARHLDNFFEIELLCGAECGSFSRPISSLSSSYSSSAKLISNIMHRWLRQPKMVLKQMSSFLPCISYLLNNPADLILPQNGYGGLLAASIVRGIRPTPILFTEHNSFVNRQKSLERHLALKPDRLIAFNPIVAQHLRRLAPRQIVETIPFGIDPAEFTPQGRAIATGLSQPNIITVADLERHSDQRIELTIKAVARLPEASLLICGEGCDRDYFQALGDRLLGRKRFQIKNFAYVQMPLVYRNADVFASAAIREPYGLKYIEAMACGLPVVATNNAVHRYSIGSGGITCDVTDLNLYAKSLRSALAKRWYQGQPRQNALRFSWQGISLLYYQAALQTMAIADRQFASAHFHSSIKS